MLFVAFVITRVVLMRFIAFYNHLQTDCELKLIFVILLSFAEINTRENLCHIKVFVIGFYLLVLQCSLTQVHLFGCMVIITFMNVYLIHT